MADRESGIHWDFDPSGSLGVRGVGSSNLPVPTISKFCAPNTAFNSDMHFRLPRTKKSTSDRKCAPRQLQKAPLASGTSPRKHFNSGE